MPADIPGFYYDNAKGKYFHILPHHAAPTPSFYSSSSVQQQQHEKQRNEKQLQEATYRLRRNRRAPLKNNPYVRATLYRELSGIASSPNHAEDVRQIYAQGLCRRAMFETDPGVKISSFAPDTVAGEASVIIGTSVGNVRILPMRENEGGDLDVNRASICPLVHWHSPVTSISISSQRCLMATFMGERQSPGIYLTSLSSASTPHQSVGLQHSFTRSNIRSIWTSAASSSPSGDLLIGTSAGAVHITPHSHVLQKTDYHIKSDVFAVEFLPTDPYPFLCGSRDGDMRLYDVRVNSTTRPDILVRHGGTITHIRALSAQGILVNGLQRCATYDLRFPHPKSPSSGFAQATRAARVYEKVVGKDASMIGLGFDVDAARGVMAVADQESWVALWSLETGEKLQSMLGERKWIGPCKGIRFDNGMQPGRVWAVEGKGLLCFAY